MLLERKLIYTAITRAKKLVVLVGSKKALAMAVRNGPQAENNNQQQQQRQPGQQHRAGRYTGLAIRLYS
jgi:ATP-dependent exoDNAse (exonuclease V) alpha subunit